MRKLPILFFLTFGASLPGFAQLDFFLDKLSNLGKIFDAGDGYVSTINDVRQIEKALSLINESRCLIDDFDYGIDVYNDEYGFDCFDNIRFDLLKVRLDNSAIMLADQLAANAMGVAQIFGDLLGSGDKAAKETAVAINKTIVSDAIDDAIASLLAIEIEAKRIKEEIEFLEKRELQMDSYISFIGNVTLPDSPDGLNKRRQENFDKMQRVGEKYFKDYDNLVSVIINVVTVILLITAGWLVAMKGETVALQTIIGLLAAVIVLSIANTFV